MITFPRTPLNFETLESREVPSASVNVVGNRLQINGDEAGNRVEINDDGRGNVSVKVTTGDAIVTTTGKGIARIDIDTFGGADVVDYRLTGNLLFRQALDFDTGEGNDNVRIDLYRGISGVPLDINVDTGAGLDAADVRFGAVNNADVNVKASLGTDADSLNVVMFNGASGKSRVAFDVAGGSGADRVNFNLMGKIDAAATLDVRASNTVDADDRFVVRYRGELDGKMNIGIDKAASGYGVQGHFTLDATSDGRLSMKLTDARRTYQSSAFVSDHRGAAKVTVLDRLVHYLTEPVGMKIQRVV